MAAQKKVHYWSLFGTYNLSTFQFELPVYKKLEMWNKTKKKP